MTLIFAQLVTGSDWTVVAAHTTMLLVNRFLLGSATGVEMTTASEYALLAVPAYPMLAIVVLSALGRRRGTGAG